MKCFFSPLPFYCCRIEKVNEKKTITREELFIRFKSLNEETRGRARNAKVVILFFGNYEESFFSPHLHLTQIEDWRSGIAKIEIKISSTMEYKTGLGQRLVGFIRRLGPGFRIFGSFRNISPLAYLLRQPPRYEVRIRSRCY